MARSLVWAPDSSRASTVPGSPVIRPSGGWARPRLRPAVRPVPLYGRSPHKWTSRMHRHLYPFSRGLPPARQRWSQPMDQQSSLLQPQNAIRGTYFALATFLSTACIGVVVKWLPADTPSTTIGFFQFFVALLLTCPWVFKRAPALAQPGGLQNLKTRRLALHLLRSLSGLFAHLFFYVAIVYVPLVDANLLLSGAPLWVPLLLLVSLRQTVTRALWISTLVGLIGVGLILHPHLQTLNRGALYGLVSGILL